MSSHLSIKASGQFLALPEDFSIDIEESNPLFNDNEMYTFPVAIPLDGNRHLVKNMEDIQSDFSAVKIEHTPMTIYVDGVPYRSGVAVVDESQELKDTLSFSIQSMKESLDDKISDLTCQDIPLKDEVQIGEAIGDVKVKFQYDYEVYTRFKEGNWHPHWKADKGEKRYAETVEQEVPLQALGFSYPFISKEDEHHNAVRADYGPDKVTNFINVSEGYPNARYCNTRVCYKHFEKNEDGTNGDKVEKGGEYDPFYVLDADRPQSGICFYVLYFLDCLFHHLNLNFDNSKLLEVEDLKNLFFFTTHCKYDLVKKEYPGDTDPNRYHFNNIEAINKWISSRANDTQHCGRLEFKPKDSKEMNSVTINGTTYEMGERTKSDINAFRPYLTLVGCAIVLREWTYSIKANVMRMLANSDNFPEESVSSILDSMWNSFGVRFIMNYETRSVKAVLIRDIYRDKTAPIVFHCDVISITKMTEKRTGVRMTYATESDEKEQKQNVKRGVKDYDTNFDYIDYAQRQLIAGYGPILKKRSNSDKTTYIDTNTGNAYRLKVDSEAETVSELNARLFEVGGYKGVAIGDCSPINEDFVTDFRIDWAPMLFTDVNIVNEMAASVDDKQQNCTSDDGTTAIINSVNKASKEQVLAAFIEDDMWHENIEISIDNAVSGDFADAALREVLTTDECYDPTSTEDGNSPLQSMDWGCTVGIMRGGGTNMTIQTYDFDYDGFGNSKWRKVAGKYAASSDSIDNWGNEYDYNGDKPGFGGGERFSLKIRSFKEDPDTHEPMCVDKPEIKSRGLFDKFMSEHAHFLLNRKIYKIECQCEIAALADITNHWERRYTIGGVTGWINKINSRISLGNGLEMVEIEMFTL